jgi:hypothetical protein
MDETLNLPVTYKGAELNFPLRILPQGYTYKFVVQIGEAEVIFERDDSGDLRALISNPDGHPEQKPPEHGLLAAIGEVIESLTA